MAEKEERIVFLKTKPKGDCPCQIDKDYCKETCWVNGKCFLGMTRAEAIEKMAKILCKSDGICKYYACGNCTEWMSETDTAEAALNALLEGNK